MNFRWSIPVVLLLLCSALASAEFQIPYLPADPSQTFTVVITPIRDHIETTQWAEFTISIRNHDMRTRKMVYGLSQEGSEFSSLTQPTSDLVAGFILEGGSVHTTHYQLKPNAQPTSFIDRSYGVQLILTDVDTGERQAIDLQVWLYPPGYFASQHMNLSIGLLSPEKFDPHNAYTLVVSLDNHNQFDIGPVVVELRSALIQKSATATLGPGGNQVVEFPVAFDPQQPPRMDLLNVTVIQDHLSIAQLHRAIEVVGYRIPFAEQQQHRIGFFTSVEQRTFTNTESVAEQQEILVPLGSFRSLTTVTPLPELVDRDGIPMYRWTQQLQPNATFTIMIVTSYRIPALVLALLLCAYLFWHLTKNPVRVLKYAEQYRTYEGGIVELKVVLSVKNHAGKVLENIQLVDKVPSITQVKEGESFGTLRPHKVVHGKSGSVLKWEIDHMDPDEERFITYVLRAKLSILGEISLPQAMVIVTDERGNKVYVKSNMAEMAKRQRTKNE